MSSAGPTSSPAQRVLRLARWLDTGLRLPGTRLRFGLDAVLGALPVVGDAAGLVLSGWLIAEAHRAGAPPALLRRMAANALLDAAAGVVPVVGDAFDLLFRANTRNAELLRRHFDPSAQPLKRSRLYRLAVLLCAATAALACWFLVHRP